MKLKNALLLPVVFLCLQSYGWGPEGHAIVGRIALQLVQPDVRQNVLALLNGMSIDTATNWMDIMKSNPEYDFMRTWHYMDVDSGKPYVPNNEDHLINRLQLSYNELKHKNLLCNEQIRTNLLVLLHLMGDLHMPLHVGYEEDKGGNARMVHYGALKTHNLHQFWDEDIIRISGITEDSCMIFFKQDQADSIYLVDFVDWMRDSRSLLDQVYDFPGYLLDDNYLNRNKTVVEKQLLKAGIRLALVLNRLFYSPDNLLKYTTDINACRKAIDLNHAQDWIGQKVTVCGLVKSVSVSPAITRLSVQMSEGEKPFTLVIFKDNYKRFKLPIDEMYAGQNIKVLGKVEEYRGNAQIIINSPADIEFL